MRTVARNLFDWLEPFASLMQGLVKDVLIGADVFVDQVLHADVVDRREGQRLL